MLFKLVRVNENRFSFTTTPHYPFTKPILLGIIIIIITLILHNINLLLIKLTRSLITSIISPITTDIGTVVVRERYDEIDGERERKHSNEIENKANSKNMSGSIIFVHN